MPWWGHPEGAPTQGSGWAFRNGKATPLCFTHEEQVASVARIELCHCRSPRQEVPTPLVPTSLVPTPREEVPTSLVPTPGQELNSEGGGAAGWIEVPLVRSNRSSTHASEPGRRCCCTSLSTCVLAGYCRCTGTAVHVHVRYSCRILASGIVKE